MAAARQHEATSRDQPPGRVWLLRLMSLGGSSAGSSPSSIYTVEQRNEQQAFPFPKELHTGHAGTCRRLQFRTSESCSLLDLRPPLCAALPAGDIDIRL